MPLKLVAPAPARRWPYYRIRGTYLGCYVDRSTGTSQKTLAEKFRKNLERDIESGALARTSGPGFAAAAAAYMKAGGDKRFLGPLIGHFTHTALDKIDQAALDNAAAEIYPEATAATRNRQVYTPVVAVLRRAGIEKRFKRPRGWESPKAVSWLEPDRAFAVFQAADVIDAEFGLFIRLLCYTGMRLGEALKTTIEQLDLDGQLLYVPKTKNTEPRQVHLPPDLVVALANHPRKLDRGPKARVFRFHASGYLRNLLAETFKSAGIAFPPRQRGFHLFRHTWATWMRRFGGLDTSGLVGTGAWRSRAAASRYEHLDATEEAQKANLLPVMGRN